MSLLFIFKFDISIASLTFIQQLKFFLSFFFVTQQVPFGLSHYICGNCPWQTHSGTCVFANLLSDTGHEIDVCVLKCRNVLGGSFPTLTPVSRPVINSGSASRPFLKYHSRDVIHKRAGRGKRAGGHARDCRKTNRPTDPTARAQASPGVPTGRPAFPPSSSRPSPPRRPAPLASAPELRPRRPGPLRKAMTLT